MRLSDAALFLAGHRGAIERLAPDRSTLVLGPLLVLSGSLARNYDGAYLPAEWHVLLHGLGASIVNSLVLFTLVYGLARAVKGVAPPFVAGYLAFLGLFWMTSPMAWLYAVPYERFLGPVDAVQANLWTLALVSAWRVLLISRVLAVLYRTRLAPLLMFVLVFADAVFLAASVVLPGPVVDFMGGLQQAPEDRLLAGVRFLTAFWSAAAFPLLLIGAAAAGKYFRPDWSLPATTAPRPRRALVAGLAVLGAWTPALITAQPEQARRCEADSLLRAGRVSEALRAMSRHSRAEFPPMWSPPPRRAYRDQTPSIRQIREGLAATEHEPIAPWARRLFFDTSLTYLKGRDSWWRNGEIGLAQLASEVKDGFWEPPPETVEAMRLHLRLDSSLSDEDREALRALLAAAEAKAR